MAKIERSILDGPTAKKGGRYSWLYIKNSNSGLFLYCDRKIALERELALKSKDRSTKGEVVELMAIKLCLNNTVSLRNFYHLQGVTY